MTPEYSPNNSSFKNIVITTRHTLSADLKGVFFDLLKFLSHKEKNIFLTPQAKAIVKNHPNYDQLPQIQHIKEIEQHDLFLFFGGDGTLLKSISLFAPFIFSLPIIGINAGNLGFFSSLSKENYSEGLSDIFAGVYQYDERMVLAGHCSKNKNKSSFFALNEASIHHSGIARVRSFTTHVSGELLTNYSADGLIISTPTGSTAYNMAGGGSIIAPQIDAFSITPLAPSGFSQRAIIIPARKHITITADAEMTISIDGQQYFPLQKHEELHLYQYIKKLCFLRQKNESYYKTLREKLGWG